MSSRSLLRTLAALLVGCAPGCRTASTPQSVAQAYALALREGRLSAAYGLLDVDSQAAESLVAFEARFGDPAARRTRAAEVEAAAPALKAGFGSLQLTHVEAGWRVAEVRFADGPRSTLARFLDAIDRADFEKAYLLLADSLRARYTPARLRSDFALAPGAADRLTRARAAMTAPPQFREGLAAFPLGGGGEVLLHREGAEYRVLALE